MKRKYSAIPKDPRHSSRSPSQLETTASDRPRAQRLQHRGNVRIQNPGRRQGGNGGLDAIGQHRQISLDARGPQPGQVQAPPPLPLLLPHVPWWRVALLIAGTGTGRLPEHGPRQSDARPVAEAAEAIGV